MKSSSKQYANKQGGVAVFLAIALSTLMIVTALGVDVSMAYSKEAELQKALNGAVLAVARGLAQEDSKSTAKAAGVEVAAANGFTIAPGDIEIDPNENNKALVKVSSSQPSPLFFLPLTGVDSLNISYVVYGVALGGNARIITEPPDDKYESLGLVPIGVPHADLLWLIQTERNDLDAADAAQLGNSLFKSGDSFVEGQEYVLKGGNNIGFRLNKIAGVGSGASNQGAIEFAGGGNGASRYERYFKFGYEGNVAIGDIVEANTGTMAGPTERANDYRVNHDVDASYLGGGEWNLEAASGRVVTVPLIRQAGVAEPADMGTGINYVGNLPYSYNGNQDYEVIGFANFLIMPYNEYPSATDPKQQGVVTGKFLKYVSTPPDGQNPG